MPASSRRQRGLLPTLPDAEAARVLRDLVAEHPRLRTEAEGLARRALGRVDPAVVARELVAAINEVSFMDVEIRCEPLPEYPRLEPAEAAWELLREQVEPFRAEMRRLLSLGLEDLAQATLRGILAGLSSLRRYRGRSCVLASAPDFEQETACRVVREWVDSGWGRKWKHGRPIPDGLLDEVVPAWSEHILRSLNRPDGWAW